MLEPAAQTEPAQEIAVERDQAQYVEESVSTKLKADNSEWFLEEDDHHRKPVSISSRPLHRPAARTQASELKASPLSLPSAQNAPASTGTLRPEPARRAKELIEAQPQQAEPASAKVEPAQEDSSAPPAIMMKVGE
jgi:hypothetical protein